MSSTLGFARPVPRSAYSSTTVQVYGHLSNDPRTDRADRPSALYEGRYLGSAILDLGGASLSPVPRSAQLPL